MQFYARLTAFEVDNPHYCAGLFRRYGGDSQNRGFMMLNAKGKLTCDAEIGRIGHWHACGKPAVARSVTPRYDHIQLDWCDQHKERGTQEGRRLLAYGEGVAS